MEFNNSIYSHIINIKNIKSGNIKSRNIKRRNIKNIKKVFDSSPDILIIILMICIAFFIFGNTAITIIYVLFSFGKKTTSILKSILVILTFLSILLLLVFTAIKTYRRKHKCN